MPIASGGPAGGQTSEEFDNQFFFKCIRSNPSGFIFHAFTHVMQKKRPVEG